jgi:hypothetical protein
MIADIGEKAKRIIENLSHDKNLGKYIDPTLDIPQAYRGTGPIKLIVLGQDPTIKDKTKREEIKTVLNLDTNGSARGYLAGVCLGLGIDLEQNVYATNLFKNFFTAPPTQIKEINILKACLDPWLQLLIEELALFNDVPAMTLGEPVLKLILKGESLHPLREHWGYILKWQSGLLFKELKYVKPEDNLLGRVLFPFPHQPSLRKEFYKQRRDDFTKFVKAIAFRDDTVHL